MKILAILTPVEGKSLDEFRPLVVDEEQALWPLYRSGIVREMYFCAAPLQVTFVMEAASLDDAAQALTVLPMVERGLLTVTTSELGPWGQLEALFSAEHRTGAGTT
ncbi:MAG: hypothetical protein ACRCS9_01530 [Hyphomicrobium sp.]